MTIQIKFWGVRGSIASPGPMTQHVGGNTSCVEVRCGEQLFILDAGTGIRALGERLLCSLDRQATILLSHLHWDHIQGLPFFAPLYRKDFHLDVLGPGLQSGLLRSVFATQMASPVFPVALEQVEEGLSFETWAPNARARFGEVEVTTCSLAHPGGSTAYRFDFQGRSLVYATDHEAALEPEGALIRLAAGADVLILDAQYLPIELDGKSGRSRRGWGHSCYAEAVEITKAAGAGTLVLFHHDPQRSDAEVAHIEALARGLHPRTIAAREGAALAVEEIPVAA